MLIPSPRSTDFITVFCSQRSDTVLCLATPFCAVSPTGEFLLSFIPPGSKGLHGSLSTSPWSALVNLGPLWPCCSWVIKLMALSDLLLNLSSCRAFHASG